MTALGCGHQDTLRAQTAVDDSLIMGEADDFGDLSHQAQADVDATECNLV